MRLEDIVARSPAPVPWAEGEKIPWNEPGFSRRMLREHLSQAHDAASRRAETIDRQVAWIREAVLGRRPVRVLDLACGPGLYTSRLARLGHECVGIDFSPASIAYARAEAEAAGLPCRYVEQDIRTAEYGSGYGLAMLLFGEFNTFRPADAETIVRRAAQALNPGGTLLLEPHGYAAIQGLGEQGSSWYSSSGGLFSERPHFCLTENAWDDTQAVATKRYFVVDAATAQVTRHAESLQAYTDEQYAALLSRCGLTDIALHHPPDGAWGAMAKELMVITARK